MDFLDPKKSRRNHYYLMVLYGLMSTGLVLATVILLSLAYGIGIGSNGNIVRSGAVLTGSNPSGADIYIDDLKQSNKTNSRIVLEEGRYVIRYEKKGYKSWQHSAVVNGGINNYMDYAFLIPDKLNTELVKSFNGHVNFSTQSPDKRWLIVSSLGGINEFLRYDLKNIDKPPLLLSFKSELLTKYDNTISWSLVDWSSDNKHLLLSRSFKDPTASRDEYILADIDNIDKSVNLTEKFALRPSDAIELIDFKFDTYYLFDSEAKQLSKIHLNGPENKIVLSDVSAYKSFGSDKILYVKASLNDTSQTGVHLLDGSKDYYLGSVSSSGPYLLDMTKHNNRLSDNWYVAFGSANDSQIEVYKDPVYNITQTPNQPIVPIQVLKVASPKYLGFSANTRFLMASNGGQSYVYDIDYDKGYLYNLSPDGTNLKDEILPSWIDGHHLIHPIGDKLEIFDYDNTNRQQLVKVDKTMPYYFTPDYKYLYTFDTNILGNSVINRTAMRIKNDL